MEIGRTRQAKAEETSPRSRRATVPSKQVEPLLQAKREEILRLAAQRGAYNVRVFGSAARGEAGPESDVDFLVN